MSMAKGRKRFWRECAKFLCMMLIIAFTCMLSACGDDEGMEVMDDVQGKEGGVQTVNAKKMGDSCWVCPLFQLAMETSEQMYKKLIPEVASGALPLLGVIYGLWLAVRVLKYVGSMNEPNQPEFWKDIGKQTFWAAMGAAMLNQINWCADFVQGVFSGFVDFGVAVVSDLPISGGNISCPQGNPKGAFICLLTAMQKKLNVGQDVSLLSMVFGDFVTIIMGVGGYVMSIVMGLYFPMLLMDGVFRMSLVMAFLPLGVVSLCFQCLRSYVGKIVTAIISIGLQIVGLSIFVAMAAGVLNKYMEEYEPMLKNPMGFLNNVAAIAKFVDGSPGLIGFIFVCFFLILFAGVIMDIMAAFGGLSPSNVMGGAVLAMRGTAQTMQKFAQYGVNRANRIKDRKAKATIEAAKRGEKVDAAKLSQAKNRMEDRGFLQKDKNGNLQKTNAYDNLDKRGARAFLGRVQQDWQSGGGAQTASRQNEKQNAISSEEKAGYI